MGDKIGVIRDIKNLKYFFKVFRYIKETDLVMATVIIAITILEGLLPGISILLSQKLINKLQIGVKNFNEILIVILLFAGMQLISTQIGYIKSFFTAKFQSKFALNLNLKIFNKVAQLELKDFEESQTFDCISRAQKESNSKLFNYFMKYIALLQQVVAIMSFVGILIQWNHRIIPLIAVVPIISVIFMKKINDKQFKIHLARTLDERKSGYLSYLMTKDIAFKEIKLYGLIDYLKTEYKKLFQGFINQDISLAKKRLNIQSILLLFDEAIVGFILYLIIKSAFLKKILIGDANSYMSCVFNIKGTIEQILAIIMVIAKDGLYIGQLFEFLDKEIAVNEEGKIIIDEIESIEVKNLSYKYLRAEKYALRNMNFRIEKKDILAIVGKNGAGKTTLIKLLSGFYNDYEGEILINGIDLKLINKESIRNQVGVIFQDYTKYELTARQNVAFGNLSQMNNDIAINNALNKSGIGNVIGKMKNGIDSQLGLWFNGVQLSGGEWQKIALSRAFMKDAGLYILDEPSSALDPEAEYEILSKSYELIKDKIGILITHRMANIERIANKIIVIDQGEIIERGSHQDLISNRSKYYELYQKQTNKKIA